MNHTTPTAGIPLEVSCGILLDPDGKILCAKRLFLADTYLPEENRWEFPGGKREPGETAEQTLIREIREELDVEVEILHPLTAVLCKTPERSLSLSPFLCRITKNTPKLRVHEELRWVTKDDLEKLDWLMPNRIILVELKDLLRKPDSPWLAHRASGR